MLMSANLAIIIKFSNFFGCLLLHSRCNVFCMTTQDCIRKEPHSRIQILPVTVERLYDGHLVLVMGCQWSLVTSYCVTRIGPFPGVIKIAKKLNLLIYYLTKCCWFSNETFTGIKFNIRMTELKWINGYMKNWNGIVSWMNV